MKQATSKQRSAEKQLHRQHKVLNYTPRHARCRPDFGGHATNQTTRRLAIVSPEADVANALLAIKANRASQILLPRASYASSADAPAPKVQPSINPVYFEFHIER